MIHVAEPYLIGNEEAYLLDCLRRNQFSGGQMVERFERAFAEWVGVDHAVAVSSGTTALHLALLAIGVGPGDEVIVPDLTFVATANAVRYCGAVPVLVDVSATDWTIDVARAEMAITERTKAIIPVHLYGYLADMDRLRLVADRHGIVLIEDAAEAHGALYRGRMAGSLGDIGCFSFYGNKIMTCGEGGMVTTDDAEVADLVRRLRGQGMDPERRYWHDIVGYNYRMTEMQAAIGLAQVEKANQLVSARRNVAEWYRQHIGKGYWQMAPLWTKPSYWMNTIITHERDRMAAVLADNDIETRPAFVPLHVMPPYRTDRDFPVATHAGMAGLCLPSHGNLTYLQVNHICSLIAKAWHVSEPSGDMLHVAQRPVAFAA